MAGVKSNIRKRANESNASKRNRNTGSRVTMITAKACQKLEGTSVETMPGQNLAGTGQVSTVVESDAAHNTARSFNTPLDIHPPMRKNSAELPKQTETIASSGKEKIMVLADTCDSLLNQNVITTTLDESEKGKSDDKPLLYHTKTGAGLMLISDQAETRGS